MKKPSKPPYISHYLVLKDLIDGIDPRQYNSEVRYLNSRLANIKCDFVKEGVRFKEDLRETTTFSWFKPYILDESPDNIKRAEKLLKRYFTPKVEAFLNEAFAG